MGWGNPNHLDPHERLYNASFHVISISLDFPFFRYYPETLNLKSILYDFLERSWKLEAVGPGLGLGVYAAHPLSWAEKQDAQVLGFKGL